MESPMKNLSLCVVFSLVVVHLASSSSSFFLYVRATSDNCQGSSLCGSVNPDDCRSAINRYTDSHIYAQYTSRVAGHCTAIFHCDGSYPSVSGANLKEQFLHVYNFQPCKKCGSHTFFDHCEATLNYCSSCRDSGDPN